MTADQNASSIDLEKLVKKGVDSLQDMLDGYADKNAYEGFPAMLRDGLAAIEALRAALDPDAVAEYVRLKSAQMVQEAVQAEREACANVADDLSVKWWGEYKGSGPNRADPHYQGMSDGAEDVSAAIRARENNKG